MKLLFIVVLGLLAGCTSKSTEQPVFEHQMFVMGTLVSVSIYGETEKKARQMFDELSADFQIMHKAWSPKEDGALKRLNDSLSKQSPAVIDSTLRDMIETSTQLSRQSEGTFNPAIGKLIDLWGFARDVPPTGPPPKTALIDAALMKNPQMSDLELIPSASKESTVSTKNPSVALNFGAFAKGYAVDRAIESLKAAGVNNAIINAGGDLRAIGGKGVKPWLIGIRHPRETEILAGIELNDGESVFTSGDYERFYAYQGQRYHHILDPRSGYPASETTSVTVLHTNAAIADAAATALFVAGPENWQRIAEKMAIEHVMLIDKAGKIYITRAMEKRLAFSNRQALALVVVNGFSE